MEKQISAVDWLVEKYIEKSVICLDDIQQAKELEKQQRQEAFEKGQLSTHKLS